MNIRHLAIAFVLGTPLVGSLARADAPTCQTYNGQGYCEYTGRVQAAYVNSSGDILLYFDTAMPPTAPASVGIGGVSTFGATIYRIADSPDYAKAMYATLLAAQSRGARVRAQMWGTYAGYLKLDRVWVYE